MIAAHSEADPGSVRDFLADLTESVNAFNTPDNKFFAAVEYIKRTFEYEEEDIKSWLKTVDYPTDVGLVDPSVIVNTLSILEAAGIVNRPDGGFLPEKFVNGQVARIE